MGDWATFPPVGFRAFISRQILRVSDAFFWAARSFSPSIESLFNLTPRLRRALDGIRRPYKTIVWAYAGISAIARNVMGVPIEVTMGQGKDVQVLDNGPWVRLINNPNPNMSKLQFIEAVIVQQKEQGASFIVKEGAGNQRIGPNDIPLELWPIGGDLFKPEFDRNLMKTTGRRKLIHWVLRAPGIAQEIRYQPHEVAIVKHIDPDDVFGWLSPLKAAQRMMRRDVKADIFDEAMLDNGAVMGGTLIVPEGQGAEQVELLRKQKEDRHAGMSKAGRLLVLEGAVTYTPSQETNRDMQFMESRKWTLDGLGASLGVPREEFSLEVGSNMITGQGVLSANAGFWQRTLTPTMNAIEDSLFKDITDLPSGGTIRIKFDRKVVKALLMDLSLAIDQGEGLKRLGWTQNQINARLELEMPMVAWGDRAYNEFGLEQIAIDTEDPAGESTDEPVDEPPPPPDDDEDEETGENGRGLHVCGGKCGNQQTKEIDAELAKELMEYYERVARTTLFPLQFTFNREWRKHLNRLRKQQLSILSTAPLGSDVEVRAALFSLAEWDQRALQSMRPVYQKAAETAVRELSNEIEVETSVTQAQIDAIINQYEKLLLFGHRTLRRRLRTNINQGRRAKEDREGLLARARQAFNKTQNRSKITSMEAISGVVNRIRTLAMQSVGITHHRWVVQSNNPRDSHRDQNGDTQEIGKKFANGLRYPHDPIGEKKERFGCQCILKPEIPEGLESFLELITLNNQRAAA